MTTELKHHWQPAEKQRHAIAGRLPAGQKHEAGERIVTLCERSVEAAVRTEITWLWPTCSECMEVAKRRIGVPA